MNASRRANGSDCIKCVKYVALDNGKFCKWNRMCQSRMEIMSTARRTFDARVYSTFDRLALTLLSLSTWQTHLGSWWCIVSHSKCVNVWTLGRLSIARFVHAFVFVACLLRFRWRQRPLSADRQFHFIYFVHATFGLEQSKASLFLSRYANAPEPSIRRPSLCFSCCFMANNLFVLLPLAHNYKENTSKCESAIYCFNARMMHATYCT